MIAIPNMDKPKNAFNCSTKINPEERRCIYTGKVFEETLSLLLDRPCDDCPIIDIVQCKDCKYFITPYENLIDADGLCDNMQVVMDKTDYCSHGERRTDE